MSKLNKLIQELCPNGVEYRKLGEVCKVLRGKRLTTRDLYEDGIVPVYHGGVEPIGYYKECNRDANSVMIINVGASAGIVGFCDKKFWSSDGCFCFSHNELLIQKFLYYALQTIEYSIKSKVRKAGIPTLDNKVIERIEIPLPPLPIQEEIVKILDRFAEYTAELQAELQARKEQYEYYRNLLLTNNFAYGSADGKQKITGNAREEWKWMTLGEVCEIGTGSSNTQDELQEGLYPFFVRSQTARWKNEYEFDETAIITSGDGVGVGKIFHYIEGKYALHQRAYRIHCISDCVIPKFLYHYMRCMFYNYINKNAFSSSVTSIRKPMLLKFPIPIMSLSEQERIVSILDKFEALVSDLTQGLPAEIAASQERYEYYRDKLLRFERCN